MVCDTVLGEGKRVDIYTLPGLPSTMELKSPEKKSQDLILSSHVAGLIQDIGEC